MYLMSLDICKKKNNLIEAVYFALCYFDYQVMYPNRDNQVVHKDISE